MNPPIMDTVATLRLVHQTIGSDDPEISSLARSVLSIIAFNLKHSTVKITRQQKNCIETLAKLANKSVGYTPRHTNKRSVNES